jgi:pyruvate ferredoxin oxidoreductase delta subunit
LAKIADNKQTKKKQYKSEDQLTWKDIEIGGISTEPGSADQNQTGDWRSRRPAYDHTKCIKCALCQTLCPEGCINQTEEGYFEADMYYCKGCGICARECPKKAIIMVEEKE